MTISVEIIEGTINPLNGSCALAYQKGPNRPVIDVDVDTYCSKKVAQQIHQFEQDKQDILMNYTPTFWKERSIHYMIASRAVVSMAFCPSFTSEHQILFMQKLGVVESRRGFMAPYLNKKELQRYGAINELSCCHQIYNEATLRNSLKQLEGTRQSQLFNILVCFLLDSKTNAVALSFVDHVDRIQTWGWIKS